MKKYILYQFPFLISGGNLKRNNKNINDQKFYEDHNKYCSPYPYIPTILPKVRRIVVLGDIHGDYNLVIKLLLIGKVIRLENNNIKWIGGDTIVVQVGDQVDRCRPTATQKCNDPDATYNDEASDIKILKLFTDLDILSREYGGMVISLIGNHELMNSLGKLDYVSHKGIQEFSNYKDTNFSDSVFDSPYEARKYAFSPGNEYGKFLGCTRLSSVIIGSNLFVHAGIVNKIMNILKINNKNDIESINMIIKKWLLGLINQEKIDKIIQSKDSIFWTRILGNIPPNTDYNESICIDHIDQVLNIFKVNNLIIGHTPQSFLYSNGINSTCSNKVWRVDNASSSAFHKFDEEFIKTGKISQSRKPQVLEILNDNQFNILY